ncbi:MAG: diguanylate cyclase, partial [Nitrospirae bacterium]|nr:diguanylate cyclase [Nitrospirota bacterium]
IEISVVQKYSYCDLLKYITLSLGIAILPEHGIETQTIFQAADNALYSAKHQGRDRACIAL